MGDDYVCVLRHGHPALRQEWTLERFMTLQHIHLSSRRKGLGQIDVALLKHGSERRIMLRVQRYRVAVAIVETTDLALSLPRYLGGKHDLEILPLPFTVPKLDFHLHWHTQSDNDASHRWLREVMTRLFKPLRKAGRCRLLLDVFFDVVQQSAAMNAGGLSVILAVIADDLTDSLAFGEREIADECVDILL